MKKIITIVLIIISLNVFSQRKTNEKFEFQGFSFEYKLVSYAKPSVSDFYVIINENSDKVEPLIKSLKNCYRLKTDFYFLNIDGNVYSNEDKENLLVEFVGLITDRRKLLDSRLYLVLKSDYTELYKKVWTKKKLNRIEELKIMELENSICELIRGF